jgi:putative hydrolase of the HAD superfamily
MGREPRIRAVIFDAVGTLLHLREPVGATYARFAAARGARIPASRLEEAFRRVLAATPLPAPEPGEGSAQAAARERAGWREIVRRSFRAADQSVRVDDEDALFDALWTHYAQPEAWTVAAGAEDALDALAASGRVLAVLSNFDQRLRPLLAALGLRGRFRAVVLPADAGAAKPDRRIFEVCLDRLGVPGPRAVYVGDHAVRDVKAARAAGLHAIDVAGSATLAGLPGRVDALEEDA